MKFMTHALAALLFSLAAMNAQATDIRQWKRDPIVVKLPVGHERILVFGHEVRVGLPGDIADSNVLRVQSTNGSVYLKAKKPFDTQRVQVQNLQTGLIMLFDLRGVKQGSHETIKIENDADSTSSDESSSNAAITHKPVPAEAFAQGSHQRGGAPLPVQLVRRAAQALYAPQRLARRASGIHRVAIHAHTMLGLMPAYPVSARPLAAWKAAPYTVTAIQITNRDSQRRFGLDPRNLAGNFYAASFMQNTIGPAGTLADTTTLFAVTKDGGLADALASTAGHAASEADNAD